MTFRRSLYFSICAHILVFGSALAFVQYVRGTFLPYSHAVQVSLISPGSLEGLRTEMFPQQHHQPQSMSPRSVELPIEGHKTNSAEVPSDLSASSQTANEGRKSSASDTSDRNGVQTVASTGAGRDGSETIGFIAPDQWAVIESAIEKSKKYPRLARERGIQGVVHVRFKLTTSGDVETVEIVKSSGYDILDDASVRTVYRAVPMPYVNGWVEVPIAYVLK